MHSETNHEHRGADQHGSEEDCEVQCSDSDSSENPRCLAVGMHGDFDNFDDFNDFDECELDHICGSDEFDDFEDVFTEGDWVEERVSPSNAGPGSAMRTLF